ncbi:HDOD domain-containing protein [Sulfurirhabdus autotrophica]|uniref:histidine kinase n=1 Tax=Sulfurirhabdus autotrophica TaxID=1706046 RepID=A0A4R3Y070_9PROT|nr:HDOD domain-containing protein [Sulfurirhabdus autotrophica]TCV83383.1 histidine kinase [Sulfurirhabdus autotrophica]
MNQNSALLLERLEVTNLPSLPHVLLKLLEACNRDNSSFRTLAEIINKDTALSSKVLGAANSAYYLRPHKITVFEQKLILLGLDAIKSIAISSSVLQVFSNITFSSEFALKRFWYNSLTSATLAKLIAHKVNFPYPDEAYLSGLLLDIGQLVLWSNFPKQYASLLGSSENETEFSLLETKQLGITHYEVGSWLINSWNLSSFMSDAVLYHHEPQERIQDAHPLIKITRLAHVLTSDEFDQEYRVSLAESLLGIDAKDVVSMLQTATEQVAIIAQSLDIDINTNTEEEPLQEALPAAEASERRKFRAAAVTTSKEPKITKSEVDNQKRLQLAREVRDISLIEGTSLNCGIATQESTLVSIQRSFYILFGLQNAMFFLYDQEYDIIYGNNMGGQSELINELVMPLEKGKNMLADALLSKSPQNSFSYQDEGNLSLIDEQIVRLSGAEGIFCIPMTSRQTQAGVAIFGIHKSQLPRLEKQTKLLTAFAQQATHSLAACHARDEQTKLIELETLTATRAKARQIVHEANNPLSIMKNYIKALGVKLDKADPAQEDLLILNEEIDRVAKIIRQLTESTDAAINLTELNINGIILDLIRIMQESLFEPNQVKVESNLDSSLPHIMTDKNKFKQVLINLIKNAVEAMSRGGQLFISSRNNVVKNKFNYCEIIIKDNGPGIPQEILDHLFEPVSTTKGKGHAGLGLTITKSIIDELDCKISCKSDIKSGTTFTILIPIN